MSDAEDVNWEDVGFVIASSYRVGVMRHLTDDGESIPSHIAEETGMGISRVSRALGELRERGLVELLVPDETRKGRIYGATDRGDRATEQLENAGGACV